MYDNATSCRARFGSCAGYVIATAQRPPKRKYNRRRDISPEKLYDIYVEECEERPVYGGIRNVNLLESCPGESFACLVINPAQKAGLFPDAQGKMGHFRN